MRLGSTLTNLGRMLVLGLVLSGSSRVASVQSEPTQSESSQSKSSPSPSSPAQTNPWGANYFPNVPVVDQDGRTLNFYDDVIKGKMVVVSFIYTSCPDICPLTTARLSLAGDQLTEQMGHDIFFVSISVDPEHDTPEKLKAFATAFDTGPGWTFLTGKPENIRWIMSKLGDKSRSLGDHRNEIVLGNDTTGEWARNTVFGDIDRLVLDIHGMDPKWRDQERVIPFNPASNTGFKLGLQPGQSLFKKICAPCHTIGVGDRVGPDLRGVADRRSPEWLARFIRHPEKMFAEHDAAAMEMTARFPGVRMPNLGLTDLDVADLITYLKTQTARIAEGDAPESAGTAHEHHHPVN
jgi:protein SCO1